MQEFNQAGGGGSLTSHRLRLEPPGDHSCNFSMAEEGGGPELQSPYSQNLLLHQYDNMTAMFPKTYLGWEPRFTWS